MHKHGRAFLLFIGWLLVWASASGQCPQPDFTIPDTVCINETFSASNATTGGDRYEWDFCSGDLEAAPVVTELVTVAGANVPTNITTVTDGTNWYAFFFSQLNNQLYRLDFGNNLNNTPAVVNLGALGGLVQRPEPLDFIKEGNAWYAFTVNANGNFNLLRLNFGSDLTSLPSVVDLGNFGGKLTRPRGLKVRYANGNYVAVVTNANDNTLTLIKIGTAVTATPGSADVIKTSPFTGTNMELTSTTLIQDCNEWYGLTLDVKASRVFKLSFGSSLFSLPSITQLPVSLPVGSELFSIQLAYNGSFTALAAGFAGSLVRFEFGASMAGPGAQVQVENFGNFNLMSNIAGFALSKQGSSWYGYAMSYSSNKIFKLKFPDPCNASLPASGLENPPAIGFSTGGVQKVILTAYNQSGVKSIGKTVFVRPMPTVDFTAAGSPPQFTAIPAPGDKFVEWQWNFGDNTTTSGPSPLHTFPGDGNYSVTLTAKSTCGQPATITRMVGVAGNTALKCPLPRFAMADTVCINEGFNITNTSIGASSYEWDFCGADFGRTPVLNSPATIPQALILSDITTVFDGTNWYGFASSRDNARLYRLSFGNSLSNSPQINDLGYPGNVLYGPEQLKFVKEGNNWYALLAQYMWFPGLVRLSFGNSLTNLPTFEKLTALNGYFKKPRGVAIENDNGKIVALITNDQDNTLTIINFKNSILNNPAAADVIVTEPLPGVSSGLVGISVIKECENWYGIATSYQKGFYKLNFGPELWKRPSVKDVTSLYNFSFGPGRAAVTNNHGNYVGFAMLLNGDLLRLDFGKSIAANDPVVTRVGGYPGDGFGLELVNRNGEQMLLTTDYNAKKIYTFQFSTGCSTNVRTSTEQNPANIRYSQGGWQKIALTAMNDKGYQSVVQDSVFVRPAVNAAFRANRRCEGGMTEFTATSALAGNRIVSWTWNFGGGVTATGPTARHSFATAGTYPVTLTVEDLCGDRVNSTQSVRIYKNSVPDFTGPTAFCSYQSVSFADASATLGDTTQDWQWNFGDGGTASGANATYTYTQAGIFTVTLTITGSSGCSVSISKQVSVTPGIGVRFSESGVCIGEQTQFNEQLSVPDGVQIVSRTWDFGDGATSSAANPVHDYTSTGSYPVTLTIVNDKGCINSFEKTITIQKLPQVSFNYSLACSEEEVAFADESVARGGSIVGWRWDFGDPESGSNNAADRQHPQHTFSKAGSYQVKLKVFTSFGCTDSTTQTITVVPSPRADFRYQLDGPTKTVAFTGQSTAGAGAVSDWYWDFGDGSIATGTQPSHTYAQAGSYAVMLVITADTRCRSVIRKTIQIFDPPQADFALPATLCAGAAVTLADNTAAATGDPVTGWQWQVGEQTFTDRSPAFTVAPGAAALEVTLTVTTASGCRSTATRRATVAPVPQARFSHEPFAPLQPLQIRFTNASEGAVRYQWNFGDGQTSDAEQPVHAYAAGGLYTVTLTTANASGCSDTAVQSVAVSAIADAYELKLEGVRVRTVGSTSSVQVRLLNNSTKTLAGLSFNFTFNESRREVQTWRGQLGPGTTLNHSFQLPEGITASDIASLCVWAKDEGSGTASNRACITPNDQFVLLNPAPNPARQQYRLAFILPQAGDARVEMTDALGRTVLNKTLRGCRQGYNEQVQPVVHLANGFYIIRLFYAGQVQTKPLLVD